MSSESLKCIICNSPSEVDTSQVFQWNFTCSRCGNFKISSRAAKILKGRIISDIQRSNISGYIRENNGFAIQETDLAFLESLPTPSVGEKARKLFEQIERQFPSAGDVIVLDWGEIKECLEAIKQSSDGSLILDDPHFVDTCKKLLPWAAISWVSSGAEFAYVLMTYLLKSKVFLENLKYGEFTITAKGWDYLETLRTTESESSTAFVAMWFDASVSSAWSDAIHPAITSAGYDPIRIDKVDHNNKIDDEIVAAIRACKFLVADFTGQRGGVYFEAGLAQGLRKQVVWLCRQDQLKDVHFDTRQYNFLLWDGANLSDLKVMLKNRIEATIGKGPKNK